ncbi:hypothetical protein J6590_037640 [Homalodisca vitripennis]|nr:hypothetical protein J6590_037640 [Homalodisca vitripennis]
MLLFSWKWSESEALSQTQQPVYSLFRETTDEKPIMRKQNDCVIKHAALRRVCCEQRDCTRESTLSLSISRIAAVDFSGHRLLRNLPAAVKSPLNIDEAWEDTKGGKRLYKEGRLLILPYDRAKRAWLPVVTRHREVFGADNTQQRDCTRESTLSLSISRIAAVDFFGHWFLSGSPELEVLTPTSILDFHCFLGEYQYDS